MSSVISRTWADDPAVVARLGDARRALRIDAADPAEEALLRGVLELRLPPEPTVADALAALRGIIDGHASAPTTSQRAGSAPR